MISAAPAVAGIAVQVPEVRLRITEVFVSLQGETSRVGLPTTFVRLTGCPLRCQFCDTAYAFHGGQSRALGELLEEIAQQGVKRVCVTGGEPLAQKSCLLLLSALCDQKYSVSLETSGAIDVSMVDARVSRIVDIKTPGSGEVVRNLWSNLSHLKQTDEIKFVICNRVDYDWSVAKLREHALSERCPVLFSPSSEQMAASELAQWIIDDRLPVRFQVQLHKYLWGGVAGR
ncbi:MAG: 7-carboxy-7-deazaguanine synthase QueE [Panacagrimonas sp.]